MYMMRLVYHCNRGKSPEMVQCLKILTKPYPSGGRKRETLYGERGARMERGVYIFLESLDRRHRTNSAIKKMI